MKKFLNVFLFIIVIPFIIFGSINSYWIPENNNNIKYETNLNATPQYNLNRSLTDDIYDNMVWVNSMISKDGVGFSNQDITISFDTNGAINLDRVYADITLAITYKDYYTYIFNNDTGIIYLYYNGEETPFSIYDDGAQFLNLTQVIDPSGNYMTDITQAPNYNLFNAKNQETWKQINLMLVDRDENTGIMLKVITHLEAIDSNNTIDINNFVNINYSFDLNVPDYATFNSFLYSMNYKDNIINQLWGGNSLYWNNLNSGKTGSFGVLFQFKMEFYNQYDNLILSTLYEENIDNGDFDDDSATVQYSGNGKNNVYYAPDNLKVNDIGHINMVWLANLKTYDNNNDTKLYFNNGADLQYEFIISEFNVFSTDPVVGLPDGGNVEYENCSWFDIFCAMRNFFTWLFFGSFLYDIMEPLLDPIYNLMNEMIIFVYSVFYTLGIFDPYLNTGNEFIVNTVISIFILILILKFIGLFGG